MQKPASKRWIIAEKISPTIESALSDYPPFFRQVLYNRGITDCEAARQFFAADCRFHDPMALMNMADTTERLWSAIDRGELIAVYGDYDVDGVTATALLVEVLESLGASVFAYIPNRFEEGYGLNLDALNSLAEQGVKIVLTVDCGIRSLAEAEHARRLGLDLIISDHHHPLDQIPNAWAVICPKLPGDVYPEKNLAGVGVAFKIAQALHQRRPQTEGWLEGWLDLVALGTVADIMPLVGENRLLVHTGLQVLRQGRRQGLVSLARAAGIDLNRVKTADIGFGLAPRLNAAGRLESALAAYHLLVEKDVQRTGLLAQQLDDQNRERQKLTQQMQAEAEAIILKEQLEEILFAFHEGFNPGVVGLVAGKLAESYYRPAVVGWIHDESVRASCRSIPEFHITRALDACADLMEHHGGHALAAGFTIQKRNLPELVERLARIAHEQLGDQLLQPVLRADVEIPLSELHPVFLNYLDQLEPTGMANPEVAFVSRGVKVARARQLSEGKHLRLTLTDRRITFDAVAFRQGHWMANGNHLPQEVDILYRFERNTYNGVTSLQLNILDIKPAGEKGVG
ncbi:MAG: single-stranded-DNA-specific exonuclease RecJ [Chloroflexota bacterium]|jgi:single-stranded-DNA-specific exonuclease